MEKKILHTALFGYSKVDVCEYISKLNEEFSLRLMETVAEKDRVQQELRDQIARLEREITRYQSERIDAADLLVDAKNYAADLRRQAEAEDAACRSANRARSEAQSHRIDDYQAAIRSIQEDLRSLNERFARELTEYDLRLEQARADFDAGCEDEIPFPAPAAAEGVAACEGSESCSDCTGAEPSLSDGRAGSCPA